MNNKKSQGEVQFKKPPAKVVAERPNDRNMETENEQLKSGDGFPGTCGGV